LAYLDVLGRSEVTKQSTPVALWIASLTLAMTVWLFEKSNPGRHHPRKRMIQYAVAFRRYR
jgi:hypothetical protein